MIVFSFVFFLTTTFLILY